MDKKVSAQEAAIAVLKKAEEMLKSSKLAKGERPGAYSTKLVQGKQVLPATGVHGAVEEHGHTKNSTISDDGQSHASKEDHKSKLSELKAMPKPSLPKSEGMPEQALSEPQDGTVAMNEEAPKQGGKGVHKLAKFMGHRAEKRKGAEMDKSEEDRSKMSGKTGMVRGMSPTDPAQKGVNHMGNNGSSGGMSEAGNAVRNSKHSSGSIKAKYQANAKEHHKNTLSEIKSMPKPNLTKKEGE